MNYLIFLLTFALLTSGLFASGRSETTITPEPASLEFSSDPGAPPSGAEKEFSTDFSRSMIDLDTILSGGPPKDGIPPIDDPVFYSVMEASLEIGKREPVIAVSLENKTKIYPLRVLMWHEIVNDKIGQIPVTVTYCPLCNTGIAFDRRTNYGILDFGTTGRLRYSNLIMYDRATESWWQQATGEAVIGELAGLKLKMIPALMLSWGQAAMSYPDAMVLSSETGHDRPYGINAYKNYDSSDRPFLYTGPAAGKEHAPLDRFLVIETSDGGLSIAYSKLRKAGIWVFSEESIVVFFEEDTASALDTSDIAEGRASGSALAYSTALGSQRLSFILKDGRNIDENTGSTWSDAGICIDGPLEGSVLTPIVSVNHFWFSFNAFYNSN